MFNNILNSIPVVGHAKGCFHYVTGNHHEARNAFYQSTRSSVVVAATMVAGPVGTVGAAALAGAGMDTVASVCTGKPQGVIAGVDNIITQASNGEFPAESLIQTGVMVGGDMLCGVGGGQIANNVSGAISSSTKHLGQDIAVAVVKSGAKANAMAVGGGYLRSECAKSSERANEFRPQARPKTVSLVLTTLSTGSAASSGVSGQQQQNNKNRSNHSKPPAGSSSNKQSSSNTGSASSSGAESLIQTGVMVGRDMLCGVGGGQIANNVSGAISSSTEHLGQDIAVAVVKSGAKANAMAAVGGYLRSECAKLSERANEFRPQARLKTVSRVMTTLSTGSAASSGGSGQQQQNNKNRSNHSKPPAGSSSNKQSSSNTGSGTGSSSGGSGQQPNNNKKKNNGQRNQTQSDSHMSVFLQLFNANSLDDIAVGRPPICIFYQLADGQRRSLLKLIRDLRRKGILEQVVETVRRLFDEMDSDDISFQNFLSLANIVSTYIGEQVAEQIATVRVLRPLTREQFNELRLTLAQGVQPNNIVQKIFDIIQSLKSKLTSSTIKPYFRNLLAAIYHYYKHRIVTHLGVILTPDKYKELIKMLLTGLKTLPEYEELQNTQHSRREVEFERYFIEFLRRVRLVVKIQDNNEELSTLYVLDDPCDDEDKDGDEFVDRKKIE